MPSFFSGGSSRNSNKCSSNDESKQEERRPEEGSWVVHHDADGRPYWRHTVTGQCTYQLLHGGHIVSPRTVHTVPAAGAFAQPQQRAAFFATSPAMQPWGHMVVPTSPPPHLIPAAADMQQGGVWQMFYDEDGDRYWGHTGTGNVTYDDPYA